MSLRYRFRYADEMLHDIHIRQPHYACIRPCQICFIEGFLFQEALSPLVYYAIEASIAGDIGLRRFRYTLLMPYTLLCL